MGERGLVDALRAPPQREVHEADLRDPALGQIGRLMVPRMIGQGAVQFSFIATTRLASQLPEGSLVVLTSLSRRRSRDRSPSGALGERVGNGSLPSSGR